MLKNRCIKIIALLIVIIQCFTIAPITANAEGGEDIAPASITPNIDLTPLIPSPTSNINTPIRANFDNTGIESYTFTATGLTASEVTPGSMDYDLTLTDEFGTFELVAIDTSGIEHKSSVYTYKNNGIGYASPISQDQAWYDCHKARYDAELITEEQFKELYNIFTKQYLFKDDSSSTPDNTISPSITTIKGRLRWGENKNDLDFLKVAKVELRKKLAIGSQVIDLVMGDDYVFTDADGNYEMKISNNQLNTNDELFIRVYLESKTAKVASDWIFDRYSFESEVLDSIVIGSTIDASYYISIDSNKSQCRAVYVHQAITIAETFALDMGLNLPESFHYQLNVAYPAIDPVFVDMGFSYGVENHLYFAGIGKTRYDDNDMIIHEYSHYVQLRLGLYGATLGELICYDWQHSAYADHFDDKDSREYAKRLTWMESWGYTFALMAHHYCDAYHSTVISNKNLERFNTRYKDDRCEAQEYAVEALLWDVFDDTPNEDLYPNDSSISAMDGLTVDYQTWWNLTTQPGMYTLADFVNNFVTARPNDASELGKIMASHNISPEITLQNPASTVFSSTSRPTVTWQGNGSEKNPHNYFEVRIYNEAGELITSYEPNVTIVNNHNQIYQHTIDSAKWSEVMSEFSGCENNGTHKVTISVWAGKKDENGALYSGMFNSEFIDVDVNVNHSHSYTECRKIDVNNHATYCVHCNAIQPGSTDGHLWTPLDDDWVECMECGYSKRLGGLGPFIPVIRPGAIDPEEDEIETE